MRQRKDAMREYCTNRPADEEIGAEVHFDRREPQTLPNGDQRLLSLEKAAIRRREAREKVVAVCVSMFRGIAIVIIGVAFTTLFLELVNAYVWPLW